MKRLLFANGRILAIAGLLHFIAIIFFFSENRLLAQTSADVAYKWAYNIGSSQQEYTNSVAVDDSGNVYITGMFDAPVDFDPGVGTAMLSPIDVYSIFVAKYDKNENYKWAFVVGGTGSDYGYGIALDSVANVYVTGMFYNTVDFDPGAGTANLTSQGATDIFFAKYNGNGNFIFAKRMGGPGNDEGFNIGLDRSANILVTGYFSYSVDFDPGAGTANMTSVSNSMDAFYAKYDNNGNYLWAHNIGTTNPDYGKAIVADAAGNVFITGWFNGGTVDFDPGAGTQNLTAAGDDIYIAKYTSGGNYVWAHNIGAASSDRGYDLKIDKSGNVLVAGYFKNTVDFDPGAGISNLISTGAEDIFFAKYDNSGNYLWAKGIGGTTGDWAYSIATDTSRNVYVAGYFQLTADFDPGAGTANLTSSGLKNIFFGKYDSNGNYIWAKRLNAPLAYDMDVDKKGNVYVAGFFSTGTVDFDPNIGVANITSAGSDDGYVAKYFGNCNLSFSTSSQNIWCPSGNNGFVTASVTGAAPPFTYTWSNSASTSAITALTAGTYSVIVRDTMGCLVSATVTITQPTAFSTTITPTQTSCVSPSGTANANVTGGTGTYTYSWNPGGQTTQMATGLGAGNYTLVVTDANLCTTSKTVTITQPSAINITTSQTNINCNGNCIGSATVTITGGSAPYTYAWSTGETTSATAANLCTGTYSILVTDNLSCTKTASVTITTPGSLSFTTTQVNVSCNGGNNGSITVNATGGTTPLQYSKDGGTNYQMSNVFTGLTAGTYSVVTKDNNGCQTSITNVIVTEPNVLSTSITPTTIDCYGATDGTATANVTGGTTLYTYSWNTSPVQITATATGLALGNYTVSVIDNNGCTSTASVSIVSTLPLVPICLVTVDTATNTQNVIVWERLVTSGVDSFRIYREIGLNNYVHIGSVHYDSLSWFTDTTNGVNPKITSYRYKISEVDTCGSESILSTHHRTIHLSTPSYTPPSTFDLIWTNDYEGFSFSQYYILRDGNNTGSWTKIDSVSYGTLSYTDINAPTDSARYIVEAAPAQPCNVSIKNPDALA
ncbi:MAG: SBBP repeat-containing protein, partial [Bacteroidetes bacterium]|nr:SBBP repeat-containing protein [Bacteroidota bacterium]